MESVLLWRCITAAAHSSREASSSGDATESIASLSKIDRAVKLDAQTEKCIGTDVPLSSTAKLAPWNDVMKLRVASETIRVDMHFRSDRNLQHEIYKFLVLAQQKSLAYKACMTRFGPQANRPPPWIGLPGFAPLLRFFEEWLYAQCLGSVRVRICAIPMLSPDGFKDTIYVERGRLAGAIRERSMQRSIADKRRVYLPLSFDRVPSKLEAVRKDLDREAAAAKKKSTTRSPDAAKEQRALALFFDIDVSRGSVAAAAAAVNQRKSGKKAYWEEFVNHLRAEGRDSDAQTVRQYRAQLATNSAPLLQHYAKSNVQSVYAEWAQSEQNQDIVKLYREWLLRRAGYVVAGDSPTSDPTEIDPVTKKYTTVREGDNPCGRGGVLRIVEDLASVLKESKQELGVLLGFVPYAQQDAISVPPHRFLDLLASISTVSLQVLRTSITDLDHSYASSVTFGLRDGVNTPRTLASWALYVALPDLRREFIQRYYAWVETETKPEKRAKKDIRDPESAAKPLRALERLYYYKFLHQFAQETTSRLLDFVVLPEASSFSESVKRLNNAIENDKVLASFVRWYDDATKHSTDPLSTPNQYGLWRKLPNLLATGAYALGSTAQLLVELLNEACREPYHALEMKDVPNAKASGVSDSFRPASAVAAGGNLTITARDVLWSTLNPAIATLKERIDEQERELKTGEAKEKEKEDRAVRRSVLLVRNYLLNRQLADANARAALIDSLDSLWAEHLGDVYTREPGMTQKEMFEDKQLWRSAMTPDELQARDKPEELFRRPTSDDYYYIPGKYITDEQQSRVPRTLRQRVLGFFSDWQDPNKGPSRDLESTLVAAFRDTSVRVREELDKQAEELRQFVNELKLSPDLRMYDVEDITQAVIEAMDVDASFEAVASASVAIPES